MAKVTLGILLLMTLAMQASLADTYKVDPVHSSIVFRIKHLYVSSVLGRFNGPTGMVQYDQAAPEKASFDVQVEAKNVDTGVAKRDAHLRTADFFDVEKYPTIRFKSSAAKSAGENTIQVTGYITLHGVTKPITVTLKHTGTGQDPKGGVLSGFETEFTINRAEYGMKSATGVGDEVKLMISLEVGKQ